MFQELKWGKFAYPLIITISLIIKKIVITSKIHVNGISNPMRIPKYSSIRINKQTRITIKLKINQ